ncbi:response regulator [bacterium]|nr:response regulator [bacterium]MBU1651624.1 response regulator [bacterium]
MGRKVLVVDDEDSTRKVLHDYLESMNLEVIHAEDGKQGLAAFLEQKPDLVITDIFMPQMTGVELLDEIKASDHPVPVVLISGVALTKAELQMQQERADGFMEKPYMFWQMKEVLEQLLPKE